MNNSNTPEISLRRAVILAGSQNPEAIKSSAFEHLDLISQAQGMSKGISAHLDLQKESIALAIQGIGLAYQAWSTHALKTSLARQKFVEETQTYLSTFVLDLQREASDFSPEEQAIFHFWQTIQTEGASLMPYFGIQTHHPEEQSKISHFAVLPYFKMSQALPQKNLIASLLEQHQQAIYLFLKTSLPNRDIVRVYHQTARFKLKLEPLWAKTNYLNRFRAPLFIIHSLANLLWNLQHPVDTATGLPLSIHENLNLCVKAELFVNLLLDDFEHSKLAKIDSTQLTLKTYLLNIERLIKSLHAGFQDQCLNHINLEDVSTSMHRASRIMANKLFELLYQDVDAAERFCAEILYLAEIIMQQPQTLKNLWPQTELLSIPGLNPKPSTLMDAIILLAHTEAAQRQKLYRRLRHETHEVYQELVDILQKLETQFLQPFETLVHRQHPKTHPKMRQLWFAQYFIALTALIMSCFTIFRDTRANPAEPDSLSDQAQRQIIMDSAASKDENRYYRWSMALFLKNQSGSAHDKIDALLAELNQMRMMTELLDKLASMVLENRILLLDKGFQRTLMDTLKKIRDAYRQLNLRLNRIEDAMNQDEHIQRSEKRILQPMLDDVEMTLESIQKSIAQVAEVINHPMFSEKQQQAIRSQMRDIQQQFQHIFSSPMEMPSLAMMRMQSLSPEEPEHLNAEKLACLKLIEICYQDLSTLSKYHPKGQALLELKRKVLAQQQYCKAELEQDLLKLIALCASPRSTYFFQANYGQTRSAKALIKTLLDPEFQFNQQFIGIIFAETEVKTKKITEAELIKRFKKLQIEHQWPMVAPEMS